MADIRSRPTDIWSWEQQEIRHRFGTALEVEYQNFGGIILILENGPLRVQINPRNDRYLTAGDSDG